MSTATDTRTRTFTFPSGETVELPAGMALCRNPKAVTHDISRYVVVGVTPAGREVRSDFSCAAYARASHVYNMRKAVARLHERANALEASGLTIKAAKLREYIAAVETKHAEAFADWAADPAPCTCPQA